MREVGLFMHLNVPSRTLNQQIWGINVFKLSFKIFSVHELVFVSLLLNSSLSFFSQNFGLT